MHPNRASGTVGQIKCNPARKWAAVINHHSNRLPVLRIRHRYPRSEGQRTMCGRIPAGIQRLTTRRPSPRGVEGRDYVLPRTTSLRFGVREEPSEAPTVSLHRRRDQPRQSQSKNAKRWTHRPFRLLHFPQRLGLICGNGNRARRGCPLRAILQAFGESKRMSALPRTSGSRHVMSAWSQWRTSA